MDNTNLKAERAAIHLGDIPLEVFKLKNGEYRLSQTQSTEAVDKTEDQFRKFLTSQSPEALPYKGFKAGKWTVNGSKGKASLIPIELTVAYWTKEAIGGNAKAARLLGACAIESIERRADAAFGVQRSEEERQIKMKARIDGKVVRRLLTDAIADYIKRHPELSENDKRWMFKNCSDRTNKLGVGKVAKKAAEELGCHQSRLRDFLETKDLVRLTSLEDLTVRLIDRYDTHPLQAVVEAAERLLIG
ncbi:MAG: hypothetical protein ICV63_08800 [Coleofasciculus sp. Co-bin14]|nr:hypothetical protein [Coleofasciculus sp. Co-bin14]